MSSTYYVKVYYTKQQQQPEIRRFGVRNISSANYFQSKNLFLLD